MTAIHVKDQAHPEKIDLGSEGDHVRCPYDQCIDADPYYRIDQGRAIYSFDQRLGGCGASVTSTTGAARKQDAQRGLDSRFLTAGAARDRTYFFPSDVYQDNYERIFGHP